MEIKKARKQEKKIIIYLIKASFKSSYILYEINEKEENDEKKKLFDSIIVEISECVLNKFTICQICDVFFIRKFGL